MRGKRRSVAGALLAGALGTPVAWAAEPWVEVRSPHFTVTSDGSEKDARGVLQQFEQVRGLLQEVWPGARVDTERPVTILAVRDEGALRALVPEFWEKRGAFHPAGVFVDAPDRGWVALRMDVARFREGDDTWDNPYLIVFHEYVHLVLRLNFDSLPTWLDEGLADFWGNTIIGGDRVYEGRHVPHHLQTLRQRTPMSLAALFAVAHGSPEYSEQDRATIFYAQSWALVHYLVLGSHEREGQLNRFAALLQAGKTAAVAATEAFGDTGALDRELQAYVRRPVFRSLRRMARLEVKQGAWTARRLSEAESLALRAGLHVGMGRAAEARDLASRALSLDPGTAAAHESLALLAWREGERSEARDALARATALPGASDYAHYLYGHLLWEILEGSEDLPRVEAAFRRATELNPSFAGAHASLARAMAARGGPVAETTTPPRVATVSEGTGGSESGAPGTGTAGLVSGEKGMAAAPASVTVALEFLVEDLRGTPVGDIRLEEVEVVQDATRQRIRTFEGKSRPGRYELTYAPRSGRAGGVTVRVTRRGTVIRGPDGGPSIKPRVIGSPPA